MNIIFFIFFLSAHFIVRKFIFGKKELKAVFIDGIFYSLAILLFGFFGYLGNGILAIDNLPIIIKLIYGIFFFFIVPYFVVFVKNKFYFQKKENLKFMTVLGEVCYVYVLSTICAIVLFYILGNIYQYKL